MGLFDNGASDDQTPETPEQQASRQRLGQGLLGLAAGMLSQGSSRMPIPPFQGLGLGLQGMLGAMSGYNQNQKTLAETGLIGAQTAETKAKTGLTQAQIDALNKAANSTPPAMFLPAGSNSPAAPGGGPPLQLATSPATGPLALIKQDESAGDYNVGVGGADLSNAPRRADGFPIWEGHKGSHAAGAYQFQPDTWAQYAKPLGIKDFSPASQDAVARAAYLDQGMAPWAPYNATLRQHLAQGLGGGVGSGQPPIQLASASGNAPAAQPIPAGSFAASPQGQYEAALAARGQGDNNQINQAGPLGMAALMRSAGMPGNAPAAPPGAAMPQAAPPGAPPPSGAPAPLPALLAQGQPQPQPGMAGQMMPGGALGGSSINPAYIQWAQQQAAIDAALGRQTPAHITAAAGLPLAGPTAAAKGWGEVGPQLFTKWNTPMDLRSNGMLMNPGNGQIIGRNPAVPEGFTVGQGPNGQPIAEEVPGAVSGIAKSEAAKKGGAYQAEFGAVPGTQLSGATAPASKEPIATPRGTQLPPLTDQFMPQSPGELEHAIPAWQKKTDEWNAGLAPARQAEMRLTTIANAFKLTESGAFETHKAELGAMLRGLGLNPSLVMGTNPAAVQEALHDNILTTLPLLKAATPRPSQIEFMSVSQNREHPNLQPAANLRMLSEDIALVRQAQQLPADWNAAQQQGWRNPQSFETSWNSLNPLDKVREQVEKEIGPLKGMPGTAPPPNAAVQYLRFNPKTRADFDAKYGAGAAAKILGQ